MLGSGRQGKVSSLICGCSFVVMGGGYGGHGGGFGGGVVTCGGISVGSLVEGDAAAAAAGVTSDCGVAGADESVGVVCG